MWGQRGSKKEDRVAFILTLTSVQRRKDWEAGWTECRRGKHAVITATFGLASGY